MRAIIPLLLAAPALAADTVVINLAGVQLRNNTNQTRDSTPNTLDTAYRYQYAVDGMVRGRGGVLGSMFPSAVPLSQVLATLDPNNTYDLSGKVWNPAGTHPFQLSNQTLSGQQVILSITVTFAATLSTGIRADGVAFFSLTSVTLSPSILTGYLEFTSGSATISRIACPADLNEDGGADFNDYLEFLNLYNDQSPDVDINADGAVDFNDYLEFLNLFNRPC